MPDSRVPLYFNLTTGDGEYRSSNVWTVFSGGGGGGTDHATLDHLDWLASGHIRSVAPVAGTLGGFNGAGATTYYMIGSDVQAYDAGLAALAAFASTGLVVATGTDTWTARTLTGPAAGITVSNGSGVAGNPTLALANDLAALEGLATTGLGARTAADTWDLRTLTAPAAGFTITNPAGVAGNPTFVLADDLAALEALATTGYAHRTGANTWTLDTVLQILDDILTTKGQLITFDTAPVAKSVSGNNGAIFTETSSSATGNDWIEYTDPGFGDGNDGNVTYSGATTLTEPVNGVNVTVNSGVRVETGGFIIRVKGLLTFTDATSIISHNGGDALIAVAGVGASGGQLGGGASGLSGSTFNTIGTNGTAQANSWGAMTGGGTTSDGGAGGAAGFAGGTGGNATEPATTARTVGNQTYDLGAIGTTVLQGGASGARGGCNTGSVCGATGGGAGVVLIWAYRVTGAGIVEANGGLGGASQLSAGIGAGGGGGGGGGRVVLLCHWIATSAPTLRALGGGGGAGAGIGAIGGSGQPGATELRMVA